MAITLWLLSSSCVGLVVRSLTAADVLETAPMLASSFDPTERGLLQRPIAIAKQALGLQKKLGATMQFIAEEDNQIIGYVELWNAEFLVGRRIRGWTYDQPDAYVSSLAVAEHARRQGVATELMRAVAERARQEGRGSISLQVEESNPPALALYSSLGYAEIGRGGRAVYSGMQFEPRLALRKRLTNSLEPSPAPPADHASAYAPSAAHRPAAIASATAGARSESRRTMRSTRMLADDGASSVVDGAEELSAEDLEVALLTEERLLLDVYAVWCGPCKLLSPEVDTIARVLGGKVRVCKFDSEQEPGGPELATSLGIGGLPTLLFLSEGEVVHRLEGALSAARIAELVEGVWFGAEMPRGPEYGDLH